MLLDLFSLPKEERDRIESMYFNRYIEKKSENDCWMWKGCKLRAGYGIFQITIDKKYYSIRAHRASWIFKYNSPIPQGLFCCHSCDNPACVNPLHIFIGTARHNFYDALRKGRLKKVVGPKPPTPLDKRIEIVKEVLAGSTFKKCAQKYNVGKTTIGDWVRSKEVQEVLGKIDISHRVLDISPYKRK